MIARDANGGAPLIVPAYQDELATVYLGDALSVLRAMPDGSVDAVVTDPPAGISFMGEAWDTFPVRRRLTDRTFRDGRARPGIARGQEHDPRARDAFVAWLTEVMAECHRLLEPGGHAVVWAIPRTSHWTATAVEDAGFEVRDVVHHLFAQGFPKSRDASAAGPSWQGWGTGLKPAAEHWILARRPLAEPNLAANLLAHGAGALNVGGCRVGPGRWPANVALSHAEGCRQDGVMRVATGVAVRHRGVIGGRVYSRTLWRHDPGAPDMTYADGDGLETVEAWDCVEGCPVAELDRQSGEHDNGFMAAGTKRDGIGYRGGLGAQVANDTYGDRGCASRFFYVAKASTADRNGGLVRERNRHPTVKPVELMRWLVRLVTPPGGVVLDCFAGSGSTLVAAKLEGMRAIGIERDPDSVEVCAKRLAWAVHQPSLLEQLPAGAGEEVSGP